MIGPCSSCHIKFFNIPWEYFEKRRAVLHFPDESSKNVIGLSRIFHEKKMYFCFRHKLPRVCVQGRTWRSVCALDFVIKLYKPIRDKVCLGLIGMCLKLHTNVSQISSRTGPESWSAYARDIIQYFSKSPVNPWKLVIGLFPWNQSSFKASFILTGYSNGSKEWWSVYARDFMLHFFAVTRLIEMRLNGLIGRWNFFFFL